MVTRANIAAAEDAGQPMTFEAIALEARRANGTNIILTPFTTDINAIPGTVSGPIRAAIVTIEAVASYVGGPQIGQHSIANSAPLEYHEAFTDIRLASGGAHSPDYQRMSNAIRRASGRR